MVFKKIKSGLCIAGLTLLTAAAPSSTMREYNCSYEPGGKNFIVSDLNSRIHVVEYRDDYKHLSLKVSNFNTPTKEEVEKDNFCPAGIFTLDHLKGCYLKQDDKKFEIYWGYQKNKHDLNEVIIYLNDIK